MSTVIVSQVTSDGPVGYYVEPRTLQSIIDVPNRLQAKVGVPTLWYDEINGTRKCVFSLFGPTKVLASCQFPFPGGSSVISAMLAINPVANEGYMTLEISGYEPVRLRYFEDVKVLKVRPGFHGAHFSG